MDAIKLGIMRRGAKQRADRLANLLANSRECSACGRRFPAEAGYIFRFTQDRARVHVRHICDNCGSRLAAMMGHGDE